MLKIGFYVSRKATRLKKFLHHVAINNLIAFKSIDFVVTDNLDDFELEKICVGFGLDFYYLDNLNACDKNTYSSDYICDLMNRRSTDYLIIYCDRIIKGRILTEYNLKIINFHPSVLPAHRGLLAIDQALSNRTMLLGNTAHFVDAGIDTGPVIMQSLKAYRDVKNYDDVLDMQIPMLVQLFAWLNDKRVHFDDGYVNVNGADYSIGPFIPNLEIFSH